MMVGRVAERFADRRYLLERVQEQQWFEENIKREVAGIQLSLRRSLSGKKSIDSGTDLRNSTLDPTG